MIYTIWRLNELDVGMSWSFATMGFSMILGVLLQLIFKFNTFIIFAIVWTGVTDLLMYLKLPDKIARSELLKNWMKKAGYSDIEEWPIKGGRKSE